MEEEKSKRKVNPIFRLCLGCVYGTSHKIIKHQDKFCSLVVQMRRFRLRNFNSLPQSLTVCESRGQNSSACPPDSDYSFSKCLLSACCIHHPLRTGAVRRGRIILCF